jgi:hypothetical protein
VLMATITSRNCWKNTSNLFDIKITRRLKLGG